MTPRVLVCYSYFEQQSRIPHLEFFLKEGLSQSPELDFTFVIQDGVCSVTIPEQKNITVLHRANEGFDFGAHAFALVDASQRFAVSVQELPYDYYIFLNDGVAGPFLPSYFPKDRHWTSIFTERFTDRVRLVGTSIVCLPASDPGGPGPRVEGFCFALDREGLAICWNEKSIFTNHSTKLEAITAGEYGLSKCILNAGYTLDCLLYRYQGVDWTNPENWMLNNLLHPSRDGTYGHISVHPFEVVFHKPVWTYEGEIVSLVNAAPAYTYMKWRMRGPQ